MQTVTKGWPPQRRLAQAQLIRASRPWCFSTGPKTTPGKNITRLNALKHGMRCAARRALYHKIRTALRAQRLFLKMVKLMHLVSFPSSPPPCAGVWQNNVPPKAAHDAFPDARTRRA